MFSKLVLLSLFALLFFVIELQSKNVILVHGAWSGPWCWQYVQPKLEKQGHVVTPVQLPGHGNDTTLPATINMASYTAAVTKVIDSITANNTQKVVLVGHSFGGNVISLAGEQRSTKISQLIYVGAYLPYNGTTVATMSASETGSYLNATSMIYDMTNLVARITNNALIDIFCADCSNEKKLQVFEEYRDEPIIPFNEVMILTPGNFGKIPKAYVHTTMDNAVTYEFQKAMVNMTPVAEVRKIKSSHCPFLSQVKDFSNILNDLLSA